MNNGKTLVLLKENGKEGICGGQCGSISRFTEADILDPEGGKRTVRFDSCRVCLMKLDQLKELFQKENGLFGSVVYAIHADELLSEHGKIACCYQSDPESRSNLALLPSKILDPFGYLFTCSHCKAIYFEPFSR